MSVAAHSPVCGTKRLFDNATPERHLDGAQLSRPLDEGWGAPAEFGPRIQKRARRSDFASPAGRCAAAYAFGPVQALQRLAVLFPEMEHKTLSTVLDECGDNIEAAIKRLGDLQLLGLDAEEAAEADVPETSASGAQVAPAVCSPQPGQEGRSAQEWVELVVSEMTAASDMDDAKARAARVLQSFESQVQTVERQSRQAEAGALTAQVADLIKNNNILKRAVQIQNTRMQEVADKEAQLAALQSTLQQYQEKVRTLELSNYSLALHLRQAESNPMTQHRHPDIF